SVMYRRSGGLKPTRYPAKNSAALAASTNRSISLCTREAAMTDFDDRSGGRHGETNNFSLSGFLNQVVGDLAQTDDVKNDSQTEVHDQFADRVEDLRTLRTIPRVFAGFNNPVCPLRGCTESDTDTNKPLISKEVSAVSVVSVEKQGGIAEPKNILG